MVVFRSGWIKAATLFAFSFVACIFSAPAVHAQVTIEEVVVTAERREESLQDVSVSVSAFEEEALSRRLFGPMNPEDPQLPAIEEARGGTLVLEDIEALSETMQARLLSVINEQGTPAETRIVAISNLQEAGRPQTRGGI